MRNLLLAAASAVAVCGCGVALAADLNVAPVYTKAPVLAPAYSWAGFYVGVNAGGGWANNKFDADPADSSFANDQSFLFNSINGKGSGGVFGGHAGYNWQFGNVVTGIEGDWDASNLRYSDGDRDDTGTSFKHTTDELASLRARIGYLLTPSLLAYGTAGGGWGHSTIPARPEFVAGFTDFNAWQSGWVAGAGLEYRLFEHVLVRGEYLHYGFGSKSTGDHTDIGTETSLPSTLHESVDVVRGGVSYKF